MFAEHENYFLKTVFGKRVKALFEKVGLFYPQFEGSFSSYLSENANFTEWIFRKARTERTDEKNELGWFILSSFVAEF